MYMYRLWLKFFLVQKFSNQYNLYFPLSQIHYQNLGQRKIKKLIWFEKFQTKEKFEPQHTFTITVQVVNKIKSSQVVCSKDVEAWMAQ